MYAPSPTYGFAPGSNQPAAPFNPNNGPPQQQQQQHKPHQQQPGQPQHMMYNPQQFAAGSPSPYGASNPGMGPGPGGMGMMQNNGMAQMAGPHVSQYQTPYSGNAYGANMPVSAGNMPQNFMPTSNVPNFQMNSTNMPMTPQQMQHVQNMQRMQPPPPSSTPTQPGPRPSPFAHNNTPPNAASQQSQFSTPQNPTQVQTQNANPNQQATVVTPQTPNFPPGAQNSGGANLAVPLSPTSETREKERVTLLLEINRELLMEVMSLQAAQAEAKKEDASPTATSPEGTEKDKVEKEKLDKSKAVSTREYAECMRRLHANLGYLAAIADRPNKPSSQIPPHPAIITAPPLVVKPAESSDAELKKEETDEKNGVTVSTEDRNQRIETLKAQYKKLQELFPGVDPKKEAAAQPDKAAPKQGAPGQSSAQKAQDVNAQQKLQNDQMRQKMMQQAQAQAHAQGR